MPTGYTADVADGKVTELEPFVMQLARGMGALILMRDSPHDAPIPEAFEPSDYHTKKLVDLRAERDSIRALTEAQAQVAADVAIAAYDDARRKAEQEHTDRYNRYNAMLAKIVGWQGAPEGIKEFGLEQLRSGRDFDCRQPFKYWMPAPERDGAAWRDAELARLHREIEYHATEHAKDCERTEGRNSWLRQLRSSLGQGEPA